MIPAHKMDFFQKVTCKGIKFIEKVYILLESKRHLQDNALVIFFLSNKSIYKKFKVLHCLKC